jgi:hypothetical protein
LVIVPTLVLVNQSIGFQVKQVWPLWSIDFELIFYFYRYKK